MPRLPVDPLLALLLVVAPLPYWVVGLPWVCGTAALRLAPAFGIGLVGWFAELGLMSGCGASIAVVIGLGLSVAILVARPPMWDDLRATLAEGYALYLVALVPAILSPFPVLGIWSGDWLHMYDAGQAVWTGGQFTAALLERPPLGGAITVPLWLIRDGLASYQLATAVGSAALLGAILHGYRVLGGSRPVGAALLPVAGSMFFLHHTATAWSKPLAAALVVAAVFLGWQARQDGTGWWRAAVAFALAVAVHQSSILYAGFMVGLAAAPWDGAGKTLGRLAACAIAGLVIVGSYESWSTARYGLNAKVNVNPSVAQRHASVSFAENTALVAVTSVVPWQPAVDMQRLIAGGRGDLTKNCYWVATGWLTATAGTILGLLLPFMPAWRVLSSGALQIPGWAWAAAIVAFAGNAVLNPFASWSGSAQTGLVPLEALLLVGLLVRLDAASSPIQWWVVGLTVVLAIIPFVVVNAGVSAGLQFSERFDAQFSAGSEGDWTERILARGLEPLGLATFPLGAACAIVGLIVVGVYARRSCELRERS